MAQIDAIGTLLNEVQYNLDHPGLQLSLQPDDPNEGILSEIKEELRTLQARLIEYDEASKAELLDWCGEKHTLDRMKAIHEVLNKLKLNNEITDSKRLDENKKAVTQLVQQLRSGTNYNTDFQNFIGLAAFREKQKARDSFFKATKQKKAILSDVGAVGESIFTLAGKTASESVAMSHAAEGMNELMGATSTLAKVSSSLPIVGAVITSVSALIQTGESFLKKRGMRDKTIKIVMTGTALAALAFTIAFPTAAIAIAAGMVAAGAIVNYVKPFFEMRSKIKKLKTEYQDLLKREQALTDNSPGLLLNAEEKTAFIQRVEAFYIQNPAITSNELMEAKQAIKTGNLEQISQHPMIENALQKNPLTFLREHCKERQASVSSSITGAEKKKKTMTALAINGMVTTVGAIMLAIPFPPVMIAGAAILVASSIAGVVIRYREAIGKALVAAKNKVLTFFGIGKKKEDKTEDNVESVKQPLVEKSEKAARASSDLFCLTELQNAATHSDKTHLSPQMPPLFDSEPSVSVTSSAASTHVSPPLPPGTLIPREPSSSQPSSKPPEGSHLPTRKF